MQQQTVDINSNMSLQKLKSALKLFVDVVNEILTLFSKKLKMKSFQKFFN